MFLSKLTSIAFKIQISVITLAFLTLYLTVVAYLYLFFSGIPFKSETYRQRMKRLVLIFVLWSICLIPKAIFTLVGINNPLSLSFSWDDFKGDQSDDLKRALIIFVLQILTEVLPFIMCLESNFLQIFVTSFQPVVQKTLPALNESKSHAIDEESLLYPQHY